MNRKNTQIKHQEAAKQRENYASTGSMLMLRTY